MAKKFSKFLMFAAAATAAGTVAYYYMKKKDSALLDDSDEDYDDFTESLDDTSSRTYVPLNRDNTPEEEPEDLIDNYQGQPSQDAPAENDTFTPLTETVARASETAREAVEETVEEFFDEADPEEASAKPDEE